MANYTSAIAQEDLYVRATVLNGTTYYYYPDTGEDNRITEFQYGDSYSIVVSGGSGSGSLSYSVENITGSGIINSNGAFTFSKAGTVWIKIQKAAYGNYQSSKILIVELTLDKRQVTVKLSPELYYNIGTEPPPEYCLNNVSVINQTVTGLAPGDTMPTTTSVAGHYADVYFVYSSEDFYRFDVFNEVYRESRYDNGVYYEVQSDGYWYIHGTASENSEYHLILSTQELPSYFIKGRKYQLNTTNDSPQLRLIFTWYLEDGTQPSTDYTASTTITVPSTAKGVALSFYVYSGYTVDTTSKFELIDLSDRAIDIQKEGMYPIAGRNATPPNTTGYKNKVKYRSTKLHYVNYSYYRIYAFYSWDEGTVTVTYQTAKPYTEIIFTVEARPGLYFKDNWVDIGEDKTTYTITETSTYAYDKFWNTGDVVCLGSTSGSVPGVYILGNDGQRVPFQQITSSLEKDSDGRMMKCSYRFKMPNSKVRIYGNFQYISESPDVPWGSYPYDDAGYGSGYPVRYVSSIYRDALLFCYWARQAYFGERDTPIMQGFRARQFYNVRDGVIDHGLTRRNLASTLTRLSHKPTNTITTPSTSGLSKDEADEYLKEAMNVSNSPNAKLYTYAGYPPKLNENGEYEDFKFTNINIFSSYGDTRELSGPGYAANDDFLYNLPLIQDISWVSWIGSFLGVYGHAFAPLRYVTFEQAATVLWRYAKFRQLDVTTSGSYYNETFASEWAQHGPLQWVIGNEISTGKTVQYYENGSLHGGTKIQPSTIMDRADWAYMLMRFCQLYAW